MKLSTSLLAACVLAMAALLPAQAADISAPPQPLVLVDNSAGVFGDTFGVNNDGNTFSDQFTFTVADFPFTVDAIVTSIGRSDSTGLDITALGLYTAANALVLTGTQVSTGLVDLWQLSGGLLDPGSYYLQVQGAVVSNGAASYDAAAVLTAVPEPAMLAMLAGGLGLMAVAARRRMRAQVEFS